MTLMSKLFATVFATSTMSTHASWGQKRTGEALNRLLQKYATVGNDVPNPVGAIGNDLPGPVSTGSFGNDLETNGHENDGFTFSNVSEDFSDEDSQPKAATIVTGTARNRNYNMSPIPGEFAITNPALQGIITRNRAQPTPKRNGASRYNLNKPKGDWGKYHNIGQKNSQTCSAYPNAKKLQPWKNQMTHGKNTIFEPRVRRWQQVMEINPQTVKPETSDHVLMNPAEVGENSFQDYYMVMQNGKTRFIPKPQRTMMYKQRSIRQRSNTKDSDFPKSRSMPQPQGEAFVVDPYTQATTRYRYSRNVAQPSHDIVTSGGNYARNYMPPNNID